MANAGIYNALMQPVRSVADYEEADQRNALLRLQLGQQQEAAKRQAAIRGAFAGGINEQAANALLQAGAVDEAVQVRNMLAKQAEAQQRQSQEQRARSYLDSLDTSTGVARPIDMTQAVAALGPEQAAKVGEVLRPKLANATPGTVVYNPVTGEPSFSVPTAQARTPLQAAQEYRASLPPGDPRLAEADAVVKNMTRPPKYAMGGGGGSRAGSGGGGMGGGPIGGGMPGAAPQPNQRSVLADKLGVPVADSDPYASLTDPKAVNSFKQKLYTESNKRLADVADAAASADSMAQDAKRFLELQKGVSVLQGPFVGRLPAVTADTQEMDAITAKITPQMRQPGSGATSDFDANMFKQSTVSREKSDTANEAIATGVVARAQMLRDREQFMRDYLSVNGHLDGADRQWKRYADKNPIFDPASPNVPKINERRASYQDFFRSGLQMPEAAGNGAAPANSGPVKVNSVQDAMRLPPGTEFIDPNGVRRVR